MSAARCLVICQPTCLKSPSAKFKTHYSVSISFTKLRLVLLPSSFPGLAGGLLVLFCRSSQEPRSLRIAHHHVRLPGSRRVQSAAQTIRAVLEAAFNFALAPPHPYITGGPRRRPGRFFSLRDRGLRAGSGSRPHPNRPDMSRSAGCTRHHHWRPQLGHFAAISSTMTITTTSNSIPYAWVP